MAIQKVYWRYKTHINHKIKNIIESEYLWANENMSFLPKYFNSRWDNINSFSGNKSWYSTEDHAIPLWHDKEFLFLQNV